jgi:hypothetical protein
MAIGLRLKVSEGTQEQYIAVHDHLNIESRPPQGLIFHARRVRSTGAGAYSTSGTAATTSTSSLKAGSCQPWPSSAIARSPSHPTSRSSQFTTT